MIVDCFTFAGEFDMLELRLRTLEDAVDRFVLCEAPFTFRGEPKPLHFAHDHERFARWRERIVPLVYPGPPSDNPWLNEWGQRDFLATALGACDPDDLILMGDCDELPDPASIARRPAPGTALVHTMLLARGFVNRLESTDRDWPGTRAILARDLPHFGSFSALRKAPLTSLTRIESGWHFSSLGGAADLVRKMRSYSHAEYDIAYYRDERRLAIELASEGTWVPLDERFPAPLHDARWAHVVAAEPVSLDVARARRLAHAHGCLAYVARAAAGDPAVAVLGREPELWADAIAHRDGLRFAGAFADAGALAATATPGAWAIVDGLEMHAPGTLSALAAAGLPAVVYVTNARSFEIFQRVVSGHAGFGAGRALGAAEVAAACAAAGYRIGARDRVFSLKLSIPYALPPGYDVALGSFSLPHVQPEPFFDFLATAFVFVLMPRAG